MENEKQPLLNELCYLAKLRNQINTRRHRARFRKNYYAHALAVVEAHNGSNAQLRYLETHNIYGKYQAKIDSIKSNMEWLKKKHPKPKKWQSMGLHKLRSLILKGEGEYALAKHQTMEFTMNNRERVKYLLTELNCGMVYDNGAVDGLTFKNGNFVGFRAIEEYATQFELNKAVENMVEEQSDDVV